MMDVKYLLYAMMEPKFIERMNSVAVGTGVKHLRVGDVEQLCIPLFSMQEQKVIVERLEEKLSIIEEQEQEIDKALLQSETLRQSILKKAFSGQLVPQDPNDEPASVLLERILAEKSEKAASKTTNKRAPAKRGRKANSKEGS
jgi:type I restriction enzyme S subunit